MVRRRTIARHRGAPGRVVLEQRGSAIDTTSTLLAGEPCSGFAVFESVVWRAISLSRLVLGTPYKTTGSHCHRGTAQPGDGDPEVARFQDDPPPLLHRSPAASPRTLRHLINHTRARAQPWAMATPLTGGHLPVLRNQRPHNGTKCAAHRFSSPPPEISQSTPPAARAPASSCSRLVGRSSRGTHSH
jgi:hypothetical protein